MGYGLEMTHVLTHTGTALSAWTSDNSLGTLGRYLHQVGPLRSSKINGVVVVAHKILVTSPEANFSRIGGLDFGLRLGLSSFSLVYQQDFFHKISHSSKMV